MKRRFIEANLLSHRYKVLSCRSCFSESIKKRILNEDQDINKDQLVKEVFHYSAPGFVHSGKEALNWVQVEDQQEDHLLPKDIPELSEDGTTVSETELISLQKGSHL